MTKPYSNFRKTIPSFTIVHSSIAQIFISRNFKQYSTEIHKCLIYKYFHYRCKSHISQFSVSLFLFKFIAISSYSQLCINRSSRIFTYFYAYVYTWFDDCGLAWAKSQIVPRIIGLSINEYKENLGIWWIIVVLGPLNLLVRMNILELIVNDRIMV